MSDKMKAAILSRFGDSGAFDWREVPIPEVGPREVRVRVRATAIIGPAYERTSAKDE